VARAGNVPYASGIEGNLQGARTGNQRLAGIAIDRDNVGALRRMADEASAVLVRSVFMEWNGQHNDQQRSEADEGRQFGELKACAAARYHFLELYANANRRE